MTTTFASDRLITDSAAAATAIATGVKTYCGAISFNDNREQLKTLCEYAKLADKSVGIVSTTRVTHATPAAFISHNESRNNEIEIANEESISGVDFLAGGGYRYFIDKKSNSNSKRVDSRNLIKEMESDGYLSFITESSIDKFVDYIPKKGDKVVALFTPSHMEYEIDRNHPVDLAMMSEKALELLSKDEDGFFLMVEGGRIDHACHANDGVSAIYDTLAFNKAVKTAIDFYQKILRIL